MNNLKAFHPCVVGLCWHCSVTVGIQLRDSVGIQLRDPTTLWSTRLQCSYATLTTSEFSSTMSSRRVQPVRACRNQQSTTNTVSLRFEFPARDSGISLNIVDVMEQIRCPGHMQAACPFLILVLNVTKLFLKLKFFSS